MKERKENIKMKKGESDLHSHYTELHNRGNDKWKSNCSKSFIFVINKDDGVKGNLL